MGLFGNKAPTTSPSEPSSAPLPDQAKKTEPNAVAATTTVESSPETQTASILAVLRRQKAETPTPNSSPPSRSPSGASKTETATVSSSSPSTVVSKRKESAHSPSTAPIAGTETPTRGISKWFQRGSRNRTSIQEELVASSTEIPRLDKCKKTDSKNSVDQPSGSKSDFVTLPKTESGEAGSTSVTDKPPRYSYEASPQPKSKKSSKTTTSPSAATATPPTPVKSTAQQKAVTLPAEASTVPTTKDPPGTDANEDEMSIISAACDPAELEEGGPNAIPPSDKAAGVETAAVNDGDNSSSDADRNSGCLLTKPSPAKQRNSSLARPPAFPNIGGDAARMGMVRRATFNLSDTEYTSDMITVTKSKKSDCWTASDASPIPIQSNITYACAGFSPAGPDAELRKALAMRKQMTMSKEKAWMDVGKQT